MGQLLDEWNQKWDDYERAVRDIEDKTALDDIRGHVRNYAMPAKAHNPPRIEDEIVWLNIDVGQQREINDLRDKISELEDRLDSMR